MDERGVVRVTLVRAEGLKAADSGGTSDPYVEVQLGKMKRTSRVIKKTLEPKWNEMLEFDTLGNASLSSGTSAVRAPQQRRERGDLVMREVQSTALVLNVYDKDNKLTGGLDDKLGQVTVGLADLLSKDTATFDLPLLPKGRLHFSVQWTPFRPRLPKGPRLHPQLQKCVKSCLRPDGPLKRCIALGGPLGAGAAAAAELSPTSKAQRVAQHGALRVHLKRANQLLAADKGGTSDPYVTVYYGQGRSAPSKRTRSIKKTVDPVWDQTLEFPSLVLRDVLKTPLVLRVYDHDGTFSRDDALGELSVSMADLQTVDSLDLTRQLPKQGNLMFSIMWVPAEQRGRH
eukprot:6795609-Prymnesium_polylepis.1